MKAGEQIAVFQSACTECTKRERFGKSPPGGGVCVCVCGVGVRGRKSISALQWRVPEPWGITQGQGVSVVSSFRYLSGRQVDRGPSLRTMPYQAL